MPGLEAAGALLTIAADRLTVRLTRRVEQLEPTHVELARAVSAVARSRGVAVDRGAAQEVQLAIAAKPDDLDVGFWRAVLGYDPRAEDNAVDPLGHGSRVWMQPSIPRSRSGTRCTWTCPSPASRRRRAWRPPSPRGDRSRTRGAPEGWILADRAGNKVCIAALLDGAMRSDR